jgi:ATP-dependent protease ClpP protease subunit
VIETKRYKLQFFAEPKKQKGTLKVQQSVSNPDTLELYYYGAICGDSYNWWTGEAVESETSANYLKNVLSKYPDTQHIVMFVNSQGGDVMEAMGIRNQLVRHHADVTGYVDGFACSAASFILTGCNKVIMYSNTMQMLHNMWTYCCGNYKELFKAATDLEQMSIGNRQAYLNKSGGKLTEEQLTEILDGESWLTAQQCLEYGLCDEIVAEEKDLTEAKEIAQMANMAVSQQIDYNRKLVAMLKQQYRPANEPPADPDEPQPPKENETINLLAVWKR